MDVAPGAVGATGASSRAAFAAYLHPQVAALLFLGFSAGLPYLLIFGTLSIWLTEAGVERAAVTYFAWAALGYSFKFVWAPLVDKLPVPFLTRYLGQRRGWMLVAQIAVMGAIAWMGFTDPTASGGLAIMALAAVALGFSSATQDIVIDAYRIEAAEEPMQAMLAAAYQAGYRCGMLVAGAVALYLASGFGTTAEQYSHDAWKYTYLCMSAAMLLGVVTTLVVAEPVRRQVSSYLHSTVDYARFLLLFALIATSFVVAFVSLGGTVELTTKWLTDAGLPGGLPGFICQAARLGIAVVVALAVARLAVATGVVQREMVQDTYVAPVADFFARYGRPAFVVLLLVGFYRVSDMVLGAIANVFYIDMGYTKETIATAAKVFGLWMTILGGFLGGWLAVKFGVMRVLMLGAVLAAATNLLFVALATSPGQVPMLYFVVAADNLSTGLAGAAFIAYLSGLTSISFTAMQYAIFSSLMTLFPKLLSGYAGTIVDAVGYPAFFVGTAVIGIPVLLLIAWVARNARDSAREGRNSP